ncbi:MAG: acyltransferase, partial [Actinobacteria bacterium]|nr:acyltransferase [Actinomycetota bacterium]
MANHFHNSARISFLSVIEISSRGTNTYIGANSVIDDFVKIKHVGGNGDVVIGMNVYLNSFTTIYSGNGVKIGDDVLIGPNCSLVPVNHNFSDKSIPIRLQRFAPSKGGIIIEEDVWIGAGVVILDGAYISKGSIIGAGSIVVKKTEPYSIASLQKQ